MLYKIKIHRIYPGVRRQLVQAGFFLNSAILGILGHGRKNGCQGADLRFASKELKSISMPAA